MIQDVAICSYEHNQVTTDLHTLNGYYWITGQMRNRLIFIQHEFLSKYALGQG